MSAAEERKERLICTEAPLAISEETSEVGAIIRHEKLQRWLAEKQDIEIYPQPEQKSANWTASIGDPGKKQGYTYMAMVLGVVTTRYARCTSGKIGEIVGLSIHGVVEKKREKKSHARWCFASTVPPCM